LLDSEGDKLVSWVCAYTDQAGDRHIETFEKKRDAEDHHDKVRADVRKGIHTAPSQSITIAEAANNWIKRVEADARERSTLDQYQQHVRLHIAPRLGRTKLAKLTATHIEKFRDDLLVTASRPLARKVLTSLKSILKVANHSQVAANVTISQDKRGKRKLEVGVDIPTPGEVKRLIAAANEPRRRALLLTTALTGLRASELRGLRWSDVDLKTCELHVRQRANRYCDIGAPKSESGRRTVPIEPDILLPALKAWKLACPLGEAGVVFPTSEGEIAQHEQMLRALAPVMTAAGVTEPVMDAQGQPKFNKRGNPLVRGKYALHAFRHFFASWCINPVNRGGRGLQAKEVQTLMGHSSIVITLDIYGHLFPHGDDRAELAAAAKRLLG
ncbi:MAG: site-specific integrase, partial [Pseudolabrys sp.]